MYPFSACVILWELGDFYTPLRATTTHGRIPIDNGAYGSPRPKLHFALFRIQSEALWRVEIPFYSLCVTLARATPWELGDFHAPSRATTTYRRITLSMAHMNYLHLNCISHSSKFRLRRCRVWKSHVLSSARVTRPRRGIYTAAAISRLQTAATFHPAAANSRRGRLTYFCRDVAAETTQRLRSIPVAHVGSIFHPRYRRTP